MRGWAIVQSFLREISTGGRPPTPGTTTDSSGSTPSS